MAKKPVTPVDAELRAARAAFESGDVGTTRARLQRAMTLLAVNSDVAYVGTKMREVRRIESLIRSPRRARTRQAPPTPVPISQPRTASTATLRALGSRADAIERHLKEGRFAEVRQELKALRGKAQALDKSSSAARAVRMRIAELQSKVSTLEARRDKRKALGPASSVLEHSSRRVISPVKGAVKKPSKTTASFICDQCKKTRPVDQAVRKPGKRRVCVPCATGQVCPSCHRTKSPDFELCIRCSGGSGQVKIVYAGAFESNRRRH